MATGKLSHEYQLFYSNQQFVLQQLLPNHISLIDDKPMATGTRIPPSNANDINFALSNEKRCQVWPLTVVINTPAIGSKRFVISWIYFHLQCRITMTICRLKAKNIDHSRILSKHERCHIEFPTSTTDPPKHSSNHMRNRSVKFAPINIAQWSTWTKKLVYIFRFRFRPIKIDKYVSEKSVLRKLFRNRFLGFF